MTRFLPLLLLVVLSGCRGPAPARGIVLITLDTTRADRLGCYGHEEARTPALDALSSQSARFTQAMAPVPVTLPSHASMFTGQYPPVHGVRYNGMFRLDESSVTVAELLSEAGWATGAIPASFPVAGSTGLGQGFQTYEDLFAGPDASKLPVTAQRKAAEVTTAGIAWLEKHSGGPFFLWLHYYDPHDPYEPPFPYSVQFREHPYDGEIAYVDREVGRFIEELRKRGLWDTTLLVVAGDHGEGLYEHGERLHSNLVYQSTLHVPLIVKAPGTSRGSVVDAPVSLVDLAPTFLDYARVPGFPGTVDGRTLGPLLRGERDEPREQYFEAIAGSLLYGWSPLEGIRRGPWKLIRSSEAELYDLAQDPAEKVDLATGEPERIADMQGSLQAALSRMNARGSDSAEVEAPLDPEALERLASLGYVGGTVTEESRGGVNPARVVHVESAVFTARELQRGRQYADALRAWDTILASDPANRHALHQSVYCLVHLEKLGEAERRARELVRLYPAYDAGYGVLGEILVRDRRAEEAASVYRAGLTELPGNVRLSYQLALTLLTLGRDQEVAAIIDPQLAGPAKAEPTFLLVRATLRARAGEGAEALDAMKQAIAQGYTDVETLRTEPLLAPLRAVPGFEEVVRLIPNEASAS